MAEWTTPDSVHSFCGETAAQEAYKTIDEDTASFWGHQVACFHWIIFDMGATVEITKIQLYQGMAPSKRWGQAAGLYVYVSDDLEDFGAAVWEGALNVSGWQETGEFSKSGRYIKLLSKDSLWSQVMYEFDAYAEVAGVAHEKTVTEILGLVDSYTRTATFHKTTTELLGLVDSYDKNKCKKCKPSVICVF